LFFRKPAVPAQVMLVDLRTNSRAGRHATLKKKKKRSQALRAKPLFDVIQKKSPLHPAAGRAEQPPCWGAPVCTSRTGKCPNCGVGSAGEATGLWHRALLRAQTGEGASLRDVGTQTLKQIPDPAAPWGGGRRGLGPYRQNQASKTQAPLPAAFLSSTDLQCYNEIKYLRKTKCV